MCSMGNAMEGFRTIFAAGFALAIVGCRSAPPPPYTDWSVRQAPAPPSATSSNAFDLYASAALDVEAKAGKYLDRVYFFPKQRELAIQAMSKGLALAGQGTHRPCEFRFTPTPPFQSPPYQRGWRLIGYGWVWQIESAVAKGDNSRAIKLTIAATKFGFDLCGGGATDASLGLTIVDEARKALAPAFGRLQNTQLAALAQGMDNALKTKPDLGVTVQNEERNMMAAVQLVQDAYRTERYAEIEDNLGADIHNAVDYLKEMKRNDATERPAYFQGFAAEAEEEVKWMSEQAAAFAIDRQKETPSRSGDRRPWWRFSRHFFMTLRPLLGANDTTVARARLLVLTASIQRTVRSGNPAPKTLGGFPTRLTTDPFSGRAFVYRADGPDFEVYSVGADFRDDGGDSDASSTFPDLRLETDSR
jgi:hypothetical protein